MAVSNIIHKFSDVDKEVVRTVQGYWTSFARGDDSAMSSWPLFSAASSEGALVHFTADGGLPSTYKEVGGEKYEEKCGFWDGMMDEFPIDA